MIAFLRQKVHTLVFVFLVVFLLVLMSHDVGNRGGTDVAEELLFRAGAPAVKAGSTATAWVSSLSREYVDLRGARAEVRKLSEALMRVERERDRLRDLAASAERLQDLLDLRVTLPPDTLAARLAGSGFASGGDTLLIDRGSQDGVTAGMPVVALGGVVGRVIQVSTGLAKVLCITDRSSGVAVIEPTGGYQGILVGGKHGSCELQYVPAFVEVSHGDLIVTSGLDRIYPQGIPVGRVVGRPTGEGVARRFEVKPLVDFQRLSEVLVIRQRPPPPEPGAGPADAGRAG